MSKSVGMKKTVKSWIISDDLWEKIKVYIPKPERNPQKKYKCAPGRGRKRVSDRKVLEGIFYILRTGCQWKAVPQEYGSGSTIHRRFQEWLKAGFFEEIWAAGLLEYDELKGIDWEWQSIDGSMVKAPLATESVGKNPTDRGKMGTKRSILTDGNGLPLAVTVGGANTHDVKLLGITLDSQIIYRPRARKSRTQNLCMDAGYTGHEVDAKKRATQPKSILENEKEKS